jgi:putative heme transporter
VTADAYRGHAAPDLGSCTKSKSGSVGGSMSNFSGSDQRGAVVPVSTRLPSRRGRKILRAVASAAVVAAAFGFALPRFASYHSVWASLQGMTWPASVVIGVAAAASLASYWFGICAVLPSLRLREAATVNLTANAVANTLPAGGALAVGVSWAMLSSWGIGTEEYVLYTLVSGIWNVFARLGLPVLALLALLTATRPDAVLIVSAAAGLTLLAAAAAGLALLLRSERFALSAGQVLQRVAGFACRVARRKTQPAIAGSLAAFRGRAAGLVAARGWRITVTTAAANVILWLALLACLRGTGLSQAQVPWQTSLAAFAFVRLLTVLPITPGGLGIIELGLVGVLAAGANHRASAQVTAAVLLWRAVTYLPPIPLGAVAFLAWRHAPALIHRSPARPPGQPTATPAATPAAVPAPGGGVGPAPAEPLALGGIGPGPSPAD